MLASVRLQVWIGLAVILCLCQGVNSRVFMGRRLTHRDHMFELIATKHGYVSATDPDSPEWQCPDKPNKNITVGYIAQQLDNFDDSNKQTWEQHYQENSQFYDGSIQTPVIFLMIGGEGPISKNWVCFENYTYMQLAATHKALVLQVEHRFFGTNKGLPDLTVDNLKYLTTKQALADLYNFIASYNKMKGFQAPRWVAFGGSYPGTMAALFRKYYPQATLGAISSSSVFGPKLDSWEYALKMEQVAKETDSLVAGCSDAIREAFTLLQQNMLTDAGRTQNRQYLSLTDDLNANLNEDDLLTVQFGVFDAFQGIFQYTYDGRSIINEKDHEFTVENLCNIMTSTHHPIQKLGEVYQLAHSQDPDPAFHPSYQRMIQPWLDTTLVGNDDNAMRGWLWLQCNQIGYLQSTSGSDLFGNVVPISYLVKMCGDLFDQKINITTIKANIQDSLNYFGQPWEFNGTNTVFAVGGYDPWSMFASNVTNNATRVVNRVTPGVGHCGDMYPSYPKEPSGLTETRQIVTEEVAYYLTLPSQWGTVQVTTSAPGNVTKFSPGQNLCSLAFLFSVVFYFLLLNN